MKKILAILFIAASIQTYAQESALLRLNLNQGDVYELKVVQKQSTGVQGGTDMTIMMDMSVTEKSEELYKTETKISSIAMDMNQGGISMSYDSSKSDEELDATGKILKSQLSPMMEAVILNTMNIYGNTLDTKVEPAIPGMEQFTSGQSSLNYPKEEISLGSTWTSDNEEQGMTVKTNYTVSKIEEGVVYLDIQGTVSGAGTGTLKGKSEIDINTGTAKMTETEISVSAQGFDVTIASQVYMIKK